MEATLGAAGGLGANLLARAAAGAVSDSFVLEHAAAGLTAAGLIGLSALNPDSDAAAAAAAASTVEAIFTPIGSMMPEGKMKQFLFSMRNTIVTELANATPEQKKEATKKRLASPKIDPTKPTAKAITAGLSAEDSKWQEIFTNIRLVTKKAVDPTTKAEKVVQAGFVTKDGGDMDLDLKLVGGVIHVTAGGKDWALQAPSGIAWEGKETTDTFTVDESNHEAGDFLRQ